MSNYVIKKWIEPYVLLETLKANYQMQEYIFDGFSKRLVKADFLSALSNEDAFGLYMKNVNKFYIFSGHEPLDVENLFGFTSEDYVLKEDSDEPIALVDAGKAEAAFIIF